MKDITKKYVNMIEAFECDFDLALQGDKRLNYLQQCIDDKDEDLIKDIELLKELSFDLRHGNIKIMQLKGE